MKRPDPGHIEEVLRLSKEIAGDLQPWPDYFDSKAMEYRMVKALTGARRVDSALEIGCGNGFTSLLLAGDAGNVMALDLPVRDPKSHSPGIETARELIKRVRARNVDVVAGSSEKIPFEDNCFDLVFSQYMLQYVRDKEKALSEIRRVLKPGGIAITVVPNFLERVYMPFIRFEYIIGRILSRIGSGFRVKGRSEDAARDPRQRPGAQGAAGVSSPAWDYFALRADGAYGGFLEEMIRHTPPSWIDLFERNGLEVTRTFSTQLLPLGLFQIMGRSSVRCIAGWSNHISRMLGGLPVLRHLGYTLGLVSVKRK